MDVNTPFEVEKAGENKASMGRIAISPSGMFFCFGLYKTQEDNIYYGRITISPLGIIFYFG